MRRLAGFLVLPLALTAGPSAAQPKAAPAFAVPPQFPTLTSAFTLGAKPGERAKLTLTGTNLTDATAVLVPAPGVKVTIPDGQKDTAKLAVELDVSADVPVGVYQLRVATKHGVSNARPLTIDDLPEVAAKDAAKKESPQKLPVPASAVGAIAAEGSAYFVVPVQAGQRLTFDAVARRTGSPLDPVVILSDAKTGRELPGLYADDTPGLQADARVTHTFPSAGEVLVEVRDTTYRGGPEFGFRLRVGDLPGATVAIPLMQDKPGEVRFAGVGLADLPAAKAGHGFAVPRWPNGPAGWPVPVLASDIPEAVEQEPNDTPKQANKLPVPGGVTARFASKGDLDHFAFAGKKGQKLEVVARAYEFNSPAEVYLRVLDAKGAELAKSDPAQPTARAEFTPPADGEYVVAAEHLNYQHGPNEVYHLSVRPVAADFEVQLGVDRVDAPPGGVGLLPVVGITKRNGFNAAIELTVVGDGFEGQLAIPAGANPQPATPLYLPVSATKDAKPRAITVRGTATIDGKPVSRLASVADVAKAGLNALPKPPPPWLTALAAGPVADPPFALAVAFDAADVPKGGTLKGKLTLTRRDGFADPVAITLLGLPANVTAKPVTIAKGETTAAVELAAAGNATAGPAAVIARGTAKPGGKEFAFAAKPTDVKVIEAKKK